jgi:hypothetical protein
MGASTWDRIYAASGIPSKTRATGESHPQVRRVDCEVFGKRVLPRARLLFLQDARRSPQPETACQALGEQPISGALRIHAGRSDSGMSPSNLICSLVVWFDKITRRRRRTQRGRHKEVVCTLSS